MKEAILVVDMLNDFATEAFCDHQLTVFEPMNRLLDCARKVGVPVIFCNDAHIKGVDKELKLWGDHAIAGTKGAEIIPEITVAPTDYVVPKRRYSGFFQTGLDLLLRELGVDTVIVAGLYSNICVRHTAGDAYCLGYNVVVPKDASDSFVATDYESDLQYLASVYNAEITDVDSVVSKWSK